MLDLRWQYYSLLHKFSQSSEKNKKLNKKFLLKIIKNLFKDNNIQFSKIEFHDHHLSHAASCLTVDGFNKNEINYIFVLDEHGDLRHSSFFEWKSNKFNLIASSKITKI